MPLLRVLPHRSSAGRSVWRACCCAGLALLAAGCQSPSTLAPVSGRVTLDGKPLAGVAITFQPLRTEASEPVASTLGSTGVTDADGRYVLRSMTTNSPGAAVGHHKVYIGPTGQSANDVAPVSQLQLPVVCSDGSLGCEVPSQGTTTANFDLKIEGR